MCELERRAVGGGQLVLAICGHSDVVSDRGNVVLLHFALPIRTFEEDEAEEAVECIVKRFST